MSNNTPSPEEIKAIRQQIIQYTQELLKGLMWVFPECNKTKMVFLHFTTITMADKEKMNEFIKDWHTALSPYYEACRKNQLDKVFKAQIPMFEQMDIPQKWADPTFNEASRKHLLIYIVRLNELVNKYQNYHGIYDFVPPILMSRIINKASELAENVKNGNDAAFRGLDLISLGESIANDTSPEEMEDFKDNLGNIQQSIQEMPALQNITNMLMGQALQSDHRDNQNSPNLDILSMLGNMISK